MDALTFSELRLNDQHFLQHAIWEELGYLPSVRVISSVVSKATFRPSIVTGVNSLVQEGSSISHS